VSIEIKNKSECCGCTACANKCPKHCIEMKEDEEGFLYPVIDLSQCIECGLCEIVCPFKQDKEVLNNPIRAYACFNKNEKVRMESSSGGIFSLIAEDILSKNGKIFACAFDKAGMAYHVKVEKKEDIAKLRGSKYMQSRLGNCYQSIKKCLDENNIVLFTGTPCQVKGLKTFLGKEYDTLYCMDFICHGVPSPKIWKKYIEYLTRTVTNSQGQIKQISFRDKTQGWSKYSLNIEFEGGKQYICRFGQDPYMQSFLRNYSLRPSCYKCKCKPSINISNLTVADFWGINEIFPDIHDDKGVSLVIINDNMGKQLFEAISTNIEFREVCYSEAVRFNKMATESVNEPVKRKEFFQKIDKENIYDLMKKYSKQKLQVRIMRNVLSIINKIKRFFSNMQGNS